MDIIDEKGDLFGLVNIIDALAVLLVVAVLMAGLVLVFGDTDTDTDTDTITVSITIEGVQPYIAEAIETGNVSKDVAITEKSVSPAESVVSDASGELHLREHPTNKTVNLQAELRVERSSEGFQFRGETLRLGSKITLDFPQVRVTGKVTSIKE